MATETEITKSPFKVSGNIQVHRDKILLIVTLIENGYCLVRHHGEVVTHTGKS